MESAFSWLSQLIETFYRFFPHIVIIRATHAGVKWVRGKHIKALQPGLHFYWPLTTEIEVLVTARQTLAIPDQVLTTKDGKKVTVKTLVVYKIRDIIQAIGKVNWDVDSTVNDLTQSAVVRVVATHTLDEILKGTADESIVNTMTKEVRKELRQYGVHIVRAKLVDFAETKVFKLLTTQPSHAALSHSQFYL